MTKFHLVAGELQGQLRAWSEGQAGALVELPGLEKVLRLGRGHYGRLPRLRAAGHPQGNIGFLNGIMEPRLKLLVLSLYFGLH